MAELVGLIASCAGLASATASVSLMLFSCASKWKSALGDLADIAADVHDLSGILDHLSSIIEKHGERIAPAAIKRLAAITKRCEITIEQLRITTELVESRFVRWKWLYRKEKTTEMKRALESFKSNISLILHLLSVGRSLDDDAAHEQEASKRRISANARHNIARLQGAILTRNNTMQRLQAAERALTDEDADFESNSTTSTVVDPASATTSLLSVLTMHKKPDKDAPDRDGDTSEELLEARRAFQREVAAAQTTGTNAIIVPGQENEMTWDSVLLRSYDALNSAPPASETLAHLLPWHPARSIADSAQPAPRGTHETSILAPASFAQDDDVPTLLQELTTISAAGLSLYEAHAKEDVNSYEGVPQWVSEEYTLTGDNPMNPADWEANPEKPPRPADEGVVVRRAYDEADSDCKPLCDVLSEHGGGYVWRHDDGNERDYYVASRLVLKYIVKPEYNRLDPELAVIRTILSKQWISKDILTKQGYDYSDFGEGGYAVPQKLTQAEVAELHMLASSRTETLLRKLSKHTKQSDRKRSTVVSRRARGLFDFSPKEANQGELPFKKDDILEVTQIVGTWWAATLRGNQGWVPYNYIELLDGPQPVPPEPQSDAKPSDAGQTDVGSTTDEAATSAAAPGEDQKTSWSRFGHNIRRVWSESVADLRAARSNAKKEGDSKRSAS